MQSIGTAALVISTTYLVAGLGWRWWYGVFSIVSGVVLISSFLFIPESLYHRPTDAFEGTVHVHHKHGGPDTAVQATVRHRVELDFVRYKARTVKDDLKIFHGKPNWKGATDCYYRMAQCILFPNILWVVLMNSAVLGIYVVSPNFSKYQVLWGVKRQMLMELSTPNDREKYTDSSFLRHRLWSLSSLESWSHLLTNFLSPVLALSKAVKSWCRFFWFPFSAGEAISSLE
jgi:hypothetical protein